MTQCAVKMRKRDIYSFFQNILWAAVLLLRLPFNWNFRNSYSGAFKGDSTNWHYNYLVFGCVGGVYFFRPPKHTNLLPYISRHTLQIDKNIDSNRYSMNGIVRKVLLSPSDTFSKYLQLKNVFLFSWLDNSIIHSLTLLLMINDLLQGIICFCSQF